MIERTGWVLAHFVWQGAAIGAMLTAALGTMRRASASARYAVCCAALVTMLASPVVTFLMMGGTGATITNVTMSETATPASGPSAPVSSDGFQPADWFPMMVALWAAGVGALSLRLAGGLVVAHRIRGRRAQVAGAEWIERVSRLAERVGVRRLVEVCESALVEVPTVVGWLKPVILIPASALARLTPGQLEALLIHELAHIRRHDYLVNLIQTVVETVLFYHPAVWWTGRRIREERENCCDDIAVSVCGDPVTYARALATLEESRLIRPQLAMAADGGSLVSRIRRLLERENGTAQTDAAWLAILVAVIVVGIGWSGTTMVTARGDGPRVPHLVPVARMEVSAIDDKPSPAVVVAAEAAPAGPEVVSSDQDSDADAEQEAPKPEPAGGSFIGGMEAAGYKNLTVDQLIAFKIHGVTPEFVGQMKAAGFSPTPDQLLAMRIHGVTGQFAKDMKDTGYAGLSVDNLVAARIHGLTPQLVRSLKASGFPDLSFDDAIAARIHGLTPEFVERVKKQGFTNLTFDKMIQLKQLKIVQ